MPFLNWKTDEVIPRHAPIAWDTIGPDHTSQYFEAEDAGKIYVLEYYDGTVIAYHPVDYSGALINPWSGYWDADGNWIS